MHRAFRFLLINLLVSWLVLPAVLAAGLPKVQIRPGKAGSAIINVSGAGHGKRSLRMTVPMRVARQLIAAARKGGVSVSTSPDKKGSMLQVVAGMGDKAVVVARHHKARNDETGTVQYGLGADAKTFHIGRRHKKHEPRGKRTTRRRRTIKRHGSTFITRPRATRRNTGRTLRWIWRPVGTRPGKPDLPDGFNQGDFGETAGKRGGRVAVTAAPATLIDQLSQSL